MAIYVLSTLNERECVFQVSAVNYGLMAQTLLLFTVDQGNVVKVGESKGSNDRAICFGTLTTHFSLHWQL